MKTTTINTMKTQTEIALESDDWDTPVMLTLIEQEADGNIRDNIMILAGFPMPGGLAMLAQSIKDGPQLQNAGITGKVIGVVLMSEVWSLIGKTANYSKVMEELSRLRAAGKGIKDHPEAREVKLFIGIDDEGMSHAEIIRGDKRVVQLPSDMQEGRIIDGLTAIWNAVNHG